MNRRKFLSIAAATGVLAISVDAISLEPNLPRIVRKEVGLRRWPENLNGFTIAVLSDFHYDPYFSIHPLKAAIGMVNALRPDLIVLGGDFVSVPLFGGDDEKTASAAEPCARLLARLNAAEGLWAVLGNHDCFTDPRRVRQALEKQGITVLANRSAAITRHGARFWLGGVNDVLSHTADLQHTLSGIPDAEATVLLAHEPDFADVVARFPVDLQLSGHFPRRPGAASLDATSLPSGDGQEIFLGSLPDRSTHSVYECRHRYGRSAGTLELSPRDHAPHAIPLCEGLSNRTFQRTARGYAARMGVSINVRCTFSARTCNCCKNLHHHADAKLKNQQLFTGLVRFNS